MKRLQFTMAIMLLAGTAITPVAANATASEPVSDEITKAATKSTLEKLDEASKVLPMGDFADGSTTGQHSNAKLIARFPDGIAAYSKDDLAVYQGERPASVHPSLFREVQSRGQNNGLYQLAEDVYQIQGDLADVTLVRGETGWIILDAGMTLDFTSPAWKYARDFLPGGKDVPVSAIVYSHSHVDHFGGVKAFTSQADVDANRVEIIAPHGFMEEVVSESILAGPAMNRRANYHFGAMLETKKDGRGLIYRPVKGGRVTLIAPTIELPKGQGEITVRTVDGVQIDFMDISGAEAPAATLLYIPKHRMLFNSELTTPLLHNIYTLRGAKVRDALYWSKLINRVIHKWGPKIDLMTGPHGPNFSGTEKITEYLTAQRDNYGFVHNQALRLSNQGVKIQDVGEQIEQLVPKSLSKLWHTRGYHGTYSHNARAVVNRYIGFYDGNPANLNPLQTKDEAIKFVTYMGGGEAVLDKAREDFAKGEYRFVATVLNKLVTAEPENRTASKLLADSYEQLGYQSEGPQWRNAYLTAAMELRAGKVLKSEAQKNSVIELLTAASVGKILDAFAISIDVERTANKKFSVLLNVLDQKEKHLIELSNGNLSSIEVTEIPSVDATIATGKAALPLLLSGRVPIDKLLASKAVSIEGDRVVLEELLKMVDRGNPDFELVPLPHHH